METYKVAPFDQNLWVHGKYLTDPTKTLGELRIFPKSLIYLRADEPSLPGTNAQRNLDEDTSWVVPQHDPQEGVREEGADGAPGHGHDGRRRDLRPRHPARARPRGR